MQIYFCFGSICLVRNVAWIINKSSDWCLHVFSINVQNVPIEMLTTDILFMRSAEGESFCAQIIFSCVYHGSDDRLFHWL